MSKSTKEKRVRNEKDCGNKNEKEEFTVGSAKWNDFTYRGLQITRTKNPSGGRTTHVSMKEYIERELAIPEWHCGAGHKVMDQKKRSVVMDLADQAIYRSLVG